MYNESLENVVASKMLGQRIDSERDVLIPDMMIKYESVRNDSFKLMEFLDDANGKN